MDAELTIMFRSREQLLDFANWFRKNGFHEYLISDDNGLNSEPISCMEADEVPEEFTDTISYFELT